MLRTPIAVFLLALSGTCGLQAASYTIGVEDIDYLPTFGIRDNNYTGFARELLDTFAKDSGHVFTYKPLPIKRLLGAMLAGDVDAKFPDNAKWAPDVRKGAAVNYSAGALEFIDGVMVKPDNKGKPIEQLKTIATVRGFTAWPLMDRISAKTLSISEQGDYPTMIEFVIRGRADGAYGSIVSAQAELKKRKAGASPELVYDPSLPFSRDFYCLSSVKQPKLISEFDAWMVAKAEVIQQMKIQYAVLVDKP